MAQRISVPDAKEKVKQRASIPRRRGQKGGITVGNSFNQTDMFLLISSMVKS